MTAPAEQLEEPESTAEERLSTEQQAARRETATALMTAARMAKDADDFVELSGYLLNFEITEDQGRRLYEAMRPKHDPLERMMAFWTPVGAMIEQRDRETETIVMTALEIALERYGAEGEVFSANTFLPLLPEHRRAMAGMVIQRMKPRLEPVGYEPSAVPSRRGSKVRTYRLRLS